MLTKKQWNKLDVGLLIFFPLLSVVLSLVLHANYLVSTLLFFGLPCAYLTYRTPKRIGKTLVFAFVLSVISVFIADFIAIINDAWITYSMFEFKVLDLIPIEDFIFGFLFVYAVVIFYEHFLDKGKNELFDPKLKYFILGGIVMISTIFFLFFKDPALLNVSYSYMWLGTLLGVVPIVVFLCMYPNNFSKYFKVAGYFFFLTLVFEITALQLGQWAFPGGDFIGWVSMFGLRFPIEELFYWTMLAAVAVVSYFEFFDD